MLSLLATSADAAQEAATPAFPPFDPWHWPSQAFWLIVTFVVLYLVLSRGILPKLAATMERRGNQIANDLDEAAKMNEQAEEATRAMELEIQRARGKARETAAAAHQEIQSEIAAETARVDAEVQEKLDAAEAKIADMRRDALANVEGIAAETAHVMATRLGASTTAEDARKTVKTVLNEA